MIYLVSDSHLGHSKLCDPNFTPHPRPKDFSFQIIQGLTKYAKRENSLIHLGDVLLADKNSRKKWYGELSKAILGYGHSTLIKGNHDRESNAFYHDLGFDAVVDGTLDFAQYVFSHRPENHHRNKLNIHGHMHGRPILDPDPHWKDISPEVVGYEPISLDGFCNLTDLDDIFS